MSVFGKEKQKMKKTVKILSVFLALVMVLCAFTSCTEKKKTSASDYLEKMLENSANAGNYKTCYEEITVDPSVFLGEGSGLGDIKVGLLTNNSGETVFSANVGANGENTDVNVFYSGNSIVVSSSMLESAYGMSLTELSSLMSMFGVTGAEPELDAELSDAASLVTGLMNTHGEKIGKILSKYIEVIVNAIDGAAEQKVDITSSTITVNIKFNSDSAKKVIKDVYNTLKKDKDLRKLVEDLAKTVSPDEYQAIVASFDAIFENDDMLEQLFAVMNEHDFEIGFSVTSDKQYRIKAFGVSGEYNGSGVSLKIDATNENNIILSVMASVEGQIVSAQVNIKTVANGNDKNVSADLTVNMAGEQMTANIFNINLKESGEFTIAISSDMMYVFGGTILGDEELGENLVEITGTFKEEGKSTELTIANVTNSVGETVTLNITVKTTYDVEFPKFPADYKLVTELGEEDLNEIMESVMGDPVVSFIMEMVEGMNGEYEF